jgi:hypothetical protein
MLSSGLFTGRASTQALQVVQAHSSQALRSPRNSVWFSLVELLLGSCLAALLHSAGFERRLVVLLLHPVARVHDDFAGRQGLQ